MENQEKLSFEIKIGDCDFGNTHYKVYGISDNNIVYSNDTSYLCKNLMLGFSMYVDKKSDVGVSIMEFIDVVRFSYGALDIDDILDFLNLIVAKYATDQHAILWLRNMKTRLKK